MSRNWQQILVEGDKGDLISGLDGLEADVASGSGGSGPAWWLPSNALAATLDASEIVSNTIGLASGDLRCTGGMVLPAGKQVTSLSFLAGGTSAVSPTHQWFALLRLADLTIVAVTGDDTSNPWNSNTTKTLPLAQPYTPNADEPVYACVCVVAGTVPTFSGQVLASSAKVVVPYPVATALSGQTVPVAVGTVIPSLNPATSSMFYAYAS